MQVNKTNTKEKVLVTGGAGFIGSHLVDKLVKSGYETSIIDDLSGGFRDNINPDCQFFECDLRSQEQAEQIIAKIKPEIVFHLAANAAENKAQFSPIDITSRNYSTFLNTLVPALKHGMKRIVVTSSIAVYGSGQYPFKEDTTPVPEDLYGLSKLMMERSLEILASVHNFEYVITRPHNVYGPRQNMRDPYRNVVTIFMNAAQKGEPYYIYGDGEQIRCFSYVDDVVDALYKCGFLDVNGMVFNVGSSNEYTLNQLSESIQSLTATAIPPVYLPERPHEVKVAIADHSLANRYLEYKDETSLADGLRKTWQYVQELGPQEPLYTEIELDSPLLPANWRNK